MDKDLVSTATIVGPLKVPGPKDWREKYRGAGEIQCAENLMFKCAACGWIHIASSGPSAADRVECSSCRSSYAQFVRATVGEVLQTVGAAVQVIALPPQFADQAAG
ncbi:hypothetical protein [Noviherbaspirillum aerium]|uniref:hypothetical protein n=1 Tax=Noviherbaspirillum aerium TaxID=2588497 RepID=UPI00124CE4E3|nr:hypothetical protein [Noviherbaspirillum aerium]